MKILEKSQLIKNQELSAKDNLESFCQIIKNVNPEINAFLEINKDQAWKNQILILRLKMEKKWVNYWTRYWS